jgi:signal peptidase I
MLPLGSPTDPAPGLGKARWRWSRRAWDGALVSCVAALAYASAFHLSVVRGASMQPGIRDGDRILVEPWSLLLSPIERGDVVVLRSPLDPDVDYIKRVIALPGELVEVGPEGVYVDGRRLQEPYAVVDGQNARQRIQVRAGHCFVMGDNRPCSADSRDFGQVPIETLRGRVDLRVWPPVRFGWID